jgi:mRNA-degrading endonuclease toxin of MazEF toxin-antitoxin module
MSNAIVPRRGEIWWAQVPQDAKRRPILVVSLDSRNQSQRMESVLAVPFTSKIEEGPNCLSFQAGETGLPGPSTLRGHFITTVPKSCFVERVRILSMSRMREVCEVIRRAYDPDPPSAVARRQP